MSPDFRVHKWGRWFVVNALTPRAVEWFRINWRTQFDPPDSRATKVDRLMGEIVWWWENRFGFIVEIDDRTLPRILKVCDDETNT